MASPPVNIMFCEAYPLYFLGAGKSLHCILQFLNRTRFHPLVVCPAEGAFAGKVRELGVEVQIVPIHPKLMVVGGSLLHSPLVARIPQAIRLGPFVFALARLIRKREIKLMHCNNLRDVLTAGWAAKIANIPLIYHCRAHSPLGPTQLTAYALSDAIITDDERSAAQFSETLLARLRPKPIKTIYEGIQLSEFDPQTSGMPVRQEFGFADGDQVVGIVASLIPRKRVDAFIEMAKVVSATFDKARFVIVGNTPEGFSSEYEDHLKYLSSDLTAKGLLVFAGWRDDLERIYAAMDIFVLPSAVEGFPLVILQAMLMGKPVVATDIAGIFMSVVDGKTGYRVPVGDAASLVAAVTRLLSDPRLAVEMGAAGRQRVIEFFSAERFVHDVEEFFLQCLV